MTFNVGAFRAAFPEFGNTTLYPDAMVTFWLSLITQQVLLPVWKGCWVQGVSLYLAHELTLAGQNAQAGAIGGTPGQQSGSPQSKQVGSVNVAYDMQPISEKDAGYWNLTNYGKQFIRLARMFGQRPIQL